MLFESEKYFEAHIRELLVTNILPLDKNLLLLENKKAVDIIICRNGENPALYFLEIKYHKHSHGRLGFGQKKGGGFQPEILSKKPSYFETNLRWILGVEDQHAYWFLTNADIIKYISGGAIGKKFNNIQSKMYKDEKSITDANLIEELKDWLLPNSYPII